MIATHHIKVGDRWYAAGEELPDLDRKESEKEEKAVEPDPATEPEKAEEPKEETPKRATSRRRK